MAAEAPPNYSIQDQQRASTSGSDGGPQITITPVANAVVFQTGNLGAEGETASLEGEVHIKGVRDDDWESLDLTLNTIEKAASNTIELVTSKVVLFSKSEGPSSSTNISRSLPPAIPFSMLLPQDTPLAVVTPTSSLTHTLTATLHPASPATTAISSTMPIQIRRYTTPLAPFLPVAPKTLTSDSPTKVSFQLPRTIWRVGEPIPIYVTLPAPEQIVLQKGLRLRNIKAELIRTVKVGAEPEKAAEGSSMGEGRWEFTHGTQPHDDVLSSTGHITPQPEGPPPAAVDGETPTAKPPPAASFYTSVITRTGSSARFHSSRPVQLRLLLHAPTQGPADSEPSDICASDYDVSTGSITQSTVLHHISFQVRVAISFVAAETHTSTTLNGSLPIIMIPPLAQHTEVVTEDLHEKYVKKHDRPPSRTIRASEDGPSTLPPPPFDASPSLGSAHATGYMTAGDPPPFFSDAGPAGLPSFQESEAAQEEGSSSFLQLAPGPSVQGPWSPVSELRFEGEGISYGFKPEDQYDGLSHSLNNAGVVRTGTPPPDMTESANDRNVTELAELIEHHPGLDVGEAHEGGVGPPPPPALDDPMDPPPGIDEGFHSAPPPVVQAAVAHLPHPPSSPPSARVVGQGGPPPYLGGAGVGSPVRESMRERQRRESAVADAAARGGPPPSYVDSEAL